MFDSYLTKTRNSLFLTFKKGNDTLHEIFQKDWGINCTEVWLKFDH